MKEKENSPTAGRRLDSYFAILDAAAKVFNQKGYNRSTVQDIATAANLTKGGLYHHLSSKEQALYGINERILNSLLTDVGAVASDQQLSVSLRIQSVIELMARQHDKLVPYLRVALLDFGSLEGEHREQIFSLRHQLESIIKSLLAEGIKEGVIVDEDPDLLSKFLFGAVNWMCMWYQPSGKFSATAIGELFAQITLHGLAPAPEVPRSPNGIGGRVGQSVKPLFRAPSRLVPRI